jgi:isopentenyl diphosphate isomerase/L-lactate dehydrogenase-like FMN-dependent dehydrogenase
VDLAALEQAARARLDPTAHQGLLHPDGELATAAGAAAAGYSALVLTADLPVYGNRPRDVRNRLEFPPDMVLGNVAGRFGAGRADPLAHASRFDAGLLAGPR